MKNLFDQHDVTELIQRIEKLAPNSSRNWGKMNVGQMLAHCNISIETAMGKHNMKRVLIGKLIGGFFRKQALNNKPFGRNSPTDKTYIFIGEHDFDTEKKKVISALREFQQGGAPACTTHPHPFFGKFTPQEWAIFQWKHLDHHLRQFGV